VRFGDQAEALFRLWNDGGDVPDVEELPVLDEVDYRWLRHYHELSARRPQGLGGAGGIPFGEIREYLDLIGYPDRLYFVRVIMETDRLVREEVAAKNSERQKVAKKRERRR